MGMIESPLFSNLSKDNPLKAQWPRDKLSLSDRSSGKCFLPLGVKNTIGFSENNKLHFFLVSHSMS